MRDIRFRAWDKELKMMMKVDSLEFSKWNVVCSQEGYNQKEIRCFSHDRNSFRNEETDRHILMQFTGLLDKNGVECFEGDILKDNKDGAIGVVIYTPPSFSVKLKEKLNEEEYWILGAGKVYPDNYKLIDTEIIGNIYENPELLK